MFDTHCHLNSVEFENGIKKVILSSREKGVEKFMIPGTDFDSSKKAAEIAYNFAGVYAAVGIHPTDDLEKLDADYELMRLQVLIDKNQKVKAVGEVGLDYYHYTAPSRIQKSVFIEQIKLAIKNSLAIVVHNRQASDDVVNILTKYGNALQGHVVLHCAEPNSELLSLAEKYDFYLGVDGDITYDKKKQEFYIDVPVTRIVLETDSPLMLPEPIRSKGRITNTPENLKYVREKLSEITGLSEETVTENTTINARKLFSI